MFGIVGSAAYCILALIIYAARGYDTGVPISLTAIVLAYLVGGVLGGAIWGLVEPWTRSFAGAYVTGVIASAPFFATLTALMMPTTPWWPQRTLVTLIAGAVVGGGAGLIISDVLKS